MKNVKEKNLLGKFWGGSTKGACQKRGWKNFLAVPKSGGNFFGGHNNFLGGEFFRKNLKKKNPRGDSLENCPNKFRGDFFRGGVYRGTCVWGMLGNKRQDRGKKNSRGQKLLWGTFWGNAKKGVEKLFGGSKKWWEFFWGHNNFLGGEFFRKNFLKKNPRGGFSGKLSKQI